MTMLAPSTFADPLIKPVRFVQRVPPAVFAFGESSFPVSFSFRDDPRPALFLKVAAIQLGAVLTDKETHGESAGVIQFAAGASETIELQASGKNIETASFYLKVPSTNGGIVVFGGNDVAEIRQPSFDGGISHVFRNGGTTVGFDPVYSGGNPYYPSATMILTVMPTTDDGWAAAPTTTATEPGGSSIVGIAPPSSYGVVDVAVDIDLRWYEDAGRTVASTSAPSVPMPSFGVRFFVSKSGKFSRRATLAGKACTVDALYPTTVLRSLGGDSVSLAYWGKGADGNGLFWGRESGIEVSSNGLAIQHGAEVASYIIANQLDDYDSSSSSTSSVSSLNSQSSSSTVLNSSSMSSRSTTSVSSVSTKSSSSKSSRSFSSSSSSSISSFSSPTSTSSSSSTEAASFSSSSSALEGIGMSSSSSLVASILARYGFETKPGTDGKVADDSGNGNELSLGAKGAGIGPPTWGPAYGRSGNGGFRFYADATNTSYLKMSGMPWSSPRGTISFWGRTPETNSGRMVAFCMSNSAADPKTEIGVAIQVADGNGAVLAWAMEDGEVLWEASSPSGTFAAGAAWHNFVFVQDGSELKAYLDGAEIPLSFSGPSGDRGAWIPRIIAASSPANSVLVGAAPRDYFPYMALGFSGWLDEITLWDEALSASDVDDIYHSPEV